VTPLKVASLAPVSSGRTIAGRDREHSRGVYMVIGCQDLLLPARAPGFEVNAKRLGIVRAVLDHRDNDIETVFVNEAAERRRKLVNHGHYYLRIRVNG